VSTLELTSDQWVETLTALAIIGAAVLIALIVPRVIVALLARLTAPSGASDLVARALRGPVGTLIVVQALFLALRRLSYLQDNWHIVERAWLATTIVVLVYGAQRLIVPLTQWYADRSAGGRSPLHSLPPLQRALRAVVWVAGALMVLATVGIEISPLLAGLGLGGLAVALAVQPLLANIFASSYLLSDQSIRIGDAVQVQGGPSGTIEDIGWRATRIRSSDNNLVIVPNSVLAQATMTNFDANAPATDVTLTLRVAPDADLDAIEVACLDELARLCEEAADQVVTGAPVSFRYQGVVEGKVEMLLRIRAASWREVGDLRHRMIIRVHNRLQSEGVALV
jgi:small-conductance mechanosensitive channel